MEIDDATSAPRISYCGMSKIFNIIFNVKDTIEIKEFLPGKFKCGNNSFRNVFELKNAVMMENMSK